MKRRQFLTFISTIFLLHCYSQDPQFLNSTQSLNHLNPSFAGSNGGIRNQFSVRQSVIASTLYNSFDAYLNKAKGGLSATYLYDETNDGGLKTNYFSMGYAQYFSARSGLRIIPSLQLAYIHRYALNTHYYGIIADDRYGKYYSGDTRHTLNATKSNLDAGAGLLLQYQNFYSGISLNHINQPDIGLVGVLPLPMRLNLHASWMIHLDERTLIHFSGQHTRQKYDQNSQVLLRVVVLKHLVAGAGFTAWHGNTPFFNLGYRGDFWSVLLSYNPDFVISGQPHSWEAAFSFSTRNKEQRRQLVNFEAW